MRWRSSACTRDAAPAGRAALQRSVKCRSIIIFACGVFGCSSTSPRPLRPYSVSYIQITVFKRGVARVPTAARAAAGARRRRRATTVLKYDLLLHTVLTKVPPNHTCILPLKSKLEGTAGMGSMHPGAPNADTVTVPSSWHLSLYEWLSFGKSTQPLATWWITGDFGLGFVQNASSKCSTIQFQVPSSFFSQWTRSLGQSGSCKHS